MKKNLYVLDQTPQGEILRQKLKMLVESEEIANQSLALQILEAGGVPDDFKMSLFMLSYYYSNENTTQARNLWRKTASKPAKFFVRKNEYNIPYPSYEIFVMMQNIEDLDEKYYAKTIFRLSSGGYGFEYCLKNNILPAKELLDLHTNYNQNTYISFSNENFDKIPPEIGEYTNLENINIDYSKITDVPEEFFNLKKLRYFSYTSSLLQDNQEIIKKINARIPMLKAQKYFEKAENYSYSNKYTQAIKELEKAVEIVPEFTDAWKTMGQYALNGKKYTEAIRPLETAIAQNANDAYCMRNLIEALYRGKEYEKCARTGEQITQDTTKMQLLQDNEYAIADFWFYKALGHFYIGEHQNSIKSNEECIKVNNYAGGWYNKACSLSKLNRINECITTLDQAINLDRSYLTMAEKDKDNDFEHLKESLAFKNLLKKYK
jgi:tetratricopeptide (TPR) repeat protein